MPGRGPDKGHGFDEMGHEITPMKTPQTQLGRGHKRHPEWVSLCVFMGVI
jgi:hypothetical protein